MPGKTKMAVITSLMVLALSPAWSAEVIESIYAIVGDEIVTHSEIQMVSRQLEKALAEQFEGEKLVTAVAEMKKSLLEQLIEQKLIMAKAKEKNYNIESDIEMIMQEIKKQNNLTTDDELKQALQSQRIDYEEWKKQIRNQRLQERLIWEEIGSKIKIDNSEILDVYRRDIAKYTVPEEVTLNCIFLKKAPPADRPQQTMEQITAALNGGDFVAVATQYSQLSGAENNYYLGKFKKGELQKELEEAVQGLKKGEHSSWVETESGWYMIQLVDRQETHQLELKDVQEEIQRALQESKQQEKLQGYVEQLKKETYIKILQEYH